MSSVATYRVTIRTDQVNEEGKSAVRIRIYKLTPVKQVRYFQTGIFLKHHPDKRKSEWNEDGQEGKNNWVTSRHFDHGALNDKLATDLKRLRKIETDHPGYSAEQIRDHYGQPEPETKSGFIAFAREHIARKHKLGQHDTADSYHTMLGYFLRFWGKRPDNPALLTPAVVADLVQFLRTCDTERGKGTGYRASTINITMAFYRSVFKGAVLEGYLPQGRNPFEVPKQQEQHRPVERPTVEQILSLRHLEGLTPAQQDARNLFLMQFFLHGARISEVYHLQWSDVGDTHIIYKPKKRATQVKMVPRHEGIEWVLAQYRRTGRYVFPYLEGTDKYDWKTRKNYVNSLNGRIADALKRIAKKAGLPPITSHMQRHVFAAHLWSLTKDIKVVQETLGHSETRTTEKYMGRIDQHIKDELTQRLYSQGNAQVNHRETNTSPAANSRAAKETKKQVNGPKKPQALAGS